MATVDPETLNDAGSIIPDRRAKWLREALGLAEGDTPFPWQLELLSQFTERTIRRLLDIPTGLGKTAVIAIWLIARAIGAALPRRLVYVVDRRAVVDQATEVAIGLREYVDRNPDLKEALGLGTRSLPISTLRGQHIDNKEWLEEPAAPAIIVGTVDMIGSRLLFEGYGTSRKMRPYHAGLLGADTLVALDEAHLVPPFEKLLETIADGNATFGPRDAAASGIIPPFKLLCLSATGQTRTDEPFGLTPADFEHSVVRRRLGAPKRLKVQPLGERKLPQALAEEAWRLLENSASTVRVIAFCDKRKDAEAAKKALETLASGDKRQGIAAVEVDTELLVGGRRVFEREEATKQLKTLGFIAGTRVERSRSSFLFATSAGEVGIDLDADHMACDLVAWERMVQRLGRVNRRGDGDARIVVLAEPEPEPKKAVRDALAKKANERSKKEFAAIEEFEATIKKVRAIRKPLEVLPRHEDGSADASPGAIRELRRQAESDSDLKAVLDAAITRVPLRPALSRALVDAWSMTSLKEHTGRPVVEPWLRGWIDDDSQTSVVWRTHLPSRPDGRVSDKEMEAFFEAAPPHASEVLQTETDQVVGWLESRVTSVLYDPTREGARQVAKDTTVLSPRLRRHDLAAVALDPAGGVRDILKLDDLLFDSADKKANGRDRERLQRTLMGSTLVVDARIAGLKDGLLDKDAESPPHTPDDGTTWLQSLDGGPVVGFRVRVADADTEPTVEDKRRWRQRFRFAIELSEDDQPRRWLIVEKWLHGAATEDDRSAGHPQLLHEHQQWAETRARELAKRLGLPADYTEMLAIAARLHDEGKRVNRWQRAFRAPTDGEYAKTRGPVNVALLDGYRHEFGSLPIAAADTDLLRLPPDLQELALHLIATHHGFGRPVIGISGCEDGPPSMLEGRATDVALRFARLQKHWGPWGLAWWESLLRAVDQQVSRKNDLKDMTPTKESV